MKKRALAVFMAVMILSVFLSACSKKPVDTSDSTSEQLTPVASANLTDEDSEVRESSETSEPKEKGESFIESVGYDPEVGFAYTDAYGNRVSVDNTELVGRLYANPLNVPYGLIPADMTNDAEGNTDGYQSPSLLPTYIAQYDDLDQYATNTFERSHLDRLIVSWVPATATPNQLVVDTATLSTIGLEKIYLPTDSSNIIIGEYPGMEDICIVVKPYGETVPTLTDIYASTSGATLDEVIASGANGIVRGTVITPNDGAASTYALMSQYDLFDGPGDYSIRVYIKMNGEWHAVDKTPLNIPVRDLVADGVLKAY